MSGKIPIKIFEYNRDRKHIRTFQNMSLCRSFHFSDIDGKIPILRFKRVDIEYGLTKDENYLVKEVFTNEVISEESYILYKIINNSYYFKVTYITFCVMK